MDKYIEIIVFYLIDWQQTAIANTRYSVVLAVLAFFIGGLFVILWKRKKTASLKQQLMQEKQAQEQLKQKYDELLIKQENDAELIVDFQQQLEQAAKKLQESEKLNAELLKKEEQLTKTLNDKQVESAGLEEALSDKTQRTEQLQNELDEQKKQLLQYSLDQSKIVEMEKEASQFADEFNIVKQQLQQLEAELNDKNEQIKQLGKTGQSAKENKNKVTELELQLEKHSNTSEAEEMQERLTQLEKELKLLEQEKQNAERQAADTVKLEKTLQQQNQQLSQFNEKLQLLVTQPLPVVEDDDLLANKGKAKEGIVSKILNLVSSIDNAGINENNEIIADDSQIEDVWKKHQRIIDRLTEQLSIQPAESEENSNQPTKIESEEITAKKHQESASDFSEQLNEVTEKMDDFQEKIKGLFHKIRS